MALKTHLFALAVESYQDEAWASIPYAENDARNFVAAWQDLGVSAEDTVLLVNQQMTLTAVQSRLRRWLAKVRPGERVIFFFAGHGIQLADANYLLTHDSLTDDLESTSLPFAAVCSALLQSAADEVLFFLDATHAGLPPDLPPFFLEKLGAEFATKQAAVFFASSREEHSHASHRLKQGLWTHSLLQALKGQATSALTNDGLLTAELLQRYLLAEVPALLRETVAGTVTQTPCCLITAGEVIVLADVGELLRQKQPAANPLGLIQDSILTGEIRGAVRELQGYQKPKTPLTSFNSWEQAFIEQAGAGNVSDQATAIFEQLRTAFGYKRKELSFACEGAQASIKTRDFDVNLALRQDTTAADQYVLCTEVAAFRRPEVVVEPSFLQLFAKYCDQVVIQLKQRLDIAAKIDEIEEYDSADFKLEYDPECTRFTLYLCESGIVIDGRVDRISFSLPGKRDLGSLIRHAHQAVAQLAEGKITLGIPVDDR